MKRILLAILFLLVTALNARAQSTTVSGTVTDTGAQTWNGGTYTFQLVANPQFPNLASYTWTGGALSQTIRGSLNGSGAYSQSVPSNSAISPQGSKWVLIACPLATSSCAASANTTITGATQTLNLTPPIIAINLQTPDQFVRAYADSEIVTAFIGGQYYNLTSGMMRDCTTVAGQVCTVWANVGAGGGGPSTPCGANMQIQYNDSGVCGADGNFTWNKATQSLSVSGDAGSLSFISAGANGDNGITVSATPFGTLGASVAVAASEVGAKLLLVSNSDVILETNGSIKHGVATIKSGQTEYVGLTSGSADFGVANVAGTPARINLPTTTGTNGQFLKTDGGTPQQTSWGTTAATAPGGTTGQLQFNNAGAFGGTTATWDAVNSRFLAPNGTSSSPAYGFTANLSTGLFFNGSTAWGLTINNINNLFATTAGVTVSGAGQTFTAPLYLTASNCSSSASPAVCGSAAAGSFVIAAAGTTVTVNTTAVTANSQIFVQQDDSLGTKLSVTCNTGFLTAPPAITARTAATSFVVTLAAGLAVNPVCLSYFIMN